MLFRSAISATSALSDGLPLFAGGKSMGGRMTSLAAAKEPLADVRGIVFFGFPLHPVQNPGIERSDHLKEAGVPLLFLQGTRDKLAQLDLLERLHRPARRRQQPLRGAGQRGQKQRDG